MKPLFSMLAPLLMAMGGCLSAPVPEELVVTGADLPREPLLMKEIVGLSKIGISDLVLVELIRNRGLADRPDLRAIAALRKEGLGEPVLLAILAAPSRTPESKPVVRIVSREWFIPLWPSYARGHWHWGLRMSCSYRVVEKEVLELQPRDPEPPEALPSELDP